MEEQFDSSQNTSNGDWANLPHIVLVQIFQKVSCLDRIYARNVCESWFTASDSKDVWKSFDLSNETVETKLDPAALQKGNTEISNGLLRSTRAVLFRILLDIIRKFGKHFVNLILHSDFAITDEILPAVCQECSNLKTVYLQNITSSRSREIVCSLLQKNKQLQSIHLVTVKFDSKNEPLPIGLHHSLTLQKLYLVNSFYSYNLGTLMYLVNLKQLSLEPQFLSYSLLYHLAGHSLTDLYIVAISKLTGFYNEAMQDWHWKEICKQGPNLCVHFRFSSSHEWTEKEILLKPSIPVKSLIYYKYRLVHFVPLSPLIQQYSSTLKVFIDFSIAMASYEAAHSDKDIVGMNKCLLDIVRKCQNLHTFAVKEVLATSTILAIVSLNKKLKELYIMEDQIIYENITDCVAIPEETKELIRENWTKENFAQTVSDMLGKSWQPLSSEEYFKTVSKACNNFV